MPDGQDTATPMEVDDCLTQLASIEFMLSQSVTLAVANLNVEPNKRESLIEDLHVKLFAVQSSMFHLSKLPK